jgi:hypothetical protein
MCRKGSKVTASKDSLDGIMQIQQAYDVLGVTETKIKIFKKDKECSNTIRETKYHPYHLERENSFSASSLVSYTNLGLQVAVVEKGGDSSFIFK